MAYAHHHNTGRPRPDLEHTPGDPINRQFKIRCKAADLETIERMARDGVTLPERKIPPGTTKSELTRIALGLDDPPDTTPGKNALEELTKRVRKT